ncbi:transglutaminase [Devosia riboflavina]|uniref:Transglutaminase n=1 Tax=Devosia riboflavina TaxID=46914 RepID=A0A087LY05_9HYPH|nr:transglutaminase family protein [Devosia riboflavina]KFL29508.1 transglutaminase [Devosia riboflavina]
MTILRVRHTSTYAYSKPVGFGQHRLMFRPRDSYDQRLLSTALSVSPNPKEVKWMLDPFGNCVTAVTFDSMATELRFETEITVDHRPSAGPDFSIDTSAKTWPLLYPEGMVPDLAPCIRVHHPSTELEKWARGFTRAGMETELGHLLMTMTVGIKESFVYSRRMTPGTQAPELTLSQRKGTCRDFAWLMIEACRALGLAARFVTGYVYVPTRDGKFLRGGGATHAWVQVFLPGAGWLEFDPTNGILGSRDLIRVGVAREPSQARPLTGNFIGSRDSYMGMKVEVNVSSIPDRSNRLPSTENDVSST